MKNKKGFTLIELLAVIVILAILLVIAIPKVTQYIAQSKQNSFVATSKDFIDAVRKDIISESLDAPIGADEVTIVSLDTVKLEKGGKKSPYGGVWQSKYSYVAVINAGTDLDPNYKYYIAISDSKRYTITLTEEDMLNRDSIIRNNSAGTKATITQMCGTQDGKYQVISHIEGLEKYRPLNGWNATIYGTGNC